VNIHPALCLEEAGGSTQEANRAGGKAVNEEHPQMLKI
jgi:hypothetical protein